MKTETYILPAYWASALINGDYSGLEDTEIKEIETFEAQNREDNCCFYCIDCSEEQYFKWRNDATNLGGDVLEYTFDVSPIKN